LKLKYTANASKAAVASPDAGDGDWVQLTVATNNGPTEYQYIALNVESGESYDLGVSEIGGSPFSVSGKYMLFAGGRDPVTNEITHPEYLYNLETREYQNVADDTLLSCSKEFPHLFDDWAVWTFWCHEPTIGLYHIPTKTLKVDYPRGLWQASPSKYNILAADTGRPDGVGSGNDLLLIEHETNRRKYITPRRITGYPTFSDRWVLFNHCAENMPCGLFLWDLEKAGITDAEGRLLP
jgi:hypothetical protein